jgi:hypothetical protein
MSNGPGSMVRLQRDGSISKTGGSVPRSTPAAASSDERANDAVFVSSAAATWMVDAAHDRPAA